MFYSCGNVNSDAAVITVPSSSSGLEAQMFFLTCGIMETSSVQMLLSSTQTHSTTLISWPLGCSSKRHQSLPLTQTVEDNAAFFSISRLKTDHTASQDWKKINRQLTSKSSLTPQQMLGAKVGCWGGFFVPTFARRVCGADRDAGQQGLCFHHCMEYPMGSPGTWNSFC